MSMLKGLVARARSLVAPRLAEDRMEEEFAFHLEKETERLMAEGVPAAEADRRARVAFGGLDRHREEMRDGRGRRLLDDIAGDIRYAVRGVRRRPGFAIAVALTLGVGIGVNGIVFGFVNGFLFRPLQAYDPARLVGIFTVNGRTGEAGLLAYEDYRDFRDNSRVFDGVAGFTGVELNVATRPASGAMADLVWGDLVTENYFTVLGMRPALGRFFTPSDERRGTTTVAVLGYDFWRRRFDADSSVVGRVMQINGAEFTVIGVAPPAFKGVRTFGFWPEIWVPMSQHDVILPGSTHLLQGRGDGWLYAFGRMHARWDMSRTRRAAALFQQQLGRAYPSTDSLYGIMLIPARTGFDHPNFIKPRVLELASAMGMLAALLALLIICANLANMQLARAAARDRELAIRLSLGCSRWRLSRQLLVEACVLAFPGAVLAAAIVRLGPLVEAQLVPHLQFRVGPGATPDGRVAAFTAIAALGAVVLFGLVPALRASRPSIAPSPASVIGRGTSRGQRGNGRASNVLVIAQLALSVVLLVGGTLFVRSLFVARGIDLGFDPSNRVMLSVNVGLQHYDAARGQQLYDRVLREVRALPGVAGATWAAPVPFDSYGRSITLYVPDAPTNARNGTLTFDATSAGDGVVRALGLRLQGGRDLTIGDSAGAPNVLVISRALATRLWPGRDPIGQRARYDDASGAAVTVVGVVGDATFSLFEDSKARAYVPLRQRYRDWETLIIHTRGSPSATLAAVRAIIERLDPTLPTFGAATMQQTVATGRSTPRMAATISGFFALLALFVAAVGLYAVIASNVAARTREIGVRIALGATPGAVLGYLMKAGARLGLWGLAIGLVGAALVARLLGGLLYGLSSGDPVSFVVPALCLTAVVLVATYLPARRAVRLDPVRALRAD